MTATLRRTAAILIACAILPTGASAQTTFNSFAGFAAGVGTLGVDSFNDLTPFTVVTGPLARNAGGFAYSVAASAAPLDAFFPLDNPDASGDTWLSTEDAFSSITFSGFAANVTAIGGNFFATNFDGFVSGTPITIRASDITGVETEVMLSPLSASAFWGVRFDNALASLTLRADNDTFNGEAFFPSVNDLVLADAAAVPEPSSIMLVLVGVGLLTLMRRRRVTR